MSLNSFMTPAFISGTFNRPTNRLPQCLAQDTATGFPDGGHHPTSPFTHTALLHLPDQQSVRQEDEIQVPGLALATSQLTLAHPEMLLAVPMKGLGPCPPPAIDSPNPRHLPVAPIGHQHLDGVDAILSLPQDDKPHGMIHLRQSHGLGEGPLVGGADFDQLATLRSNLPGDFGRAHLLALKDYLPIELQITHIATPVTVNEIEDGRIGEVAVAGEIPGNLVRDDPTNQLLDQFRMALEDGFCFSGMAAAIPPGCAARCSCQAWQASLLRKRPHSSG